MSFYGNGMFEFVSDERTREMLQNAHMAFTVTELWKWYANYTPDMHRSLYSNPNMDRVQKYMEGQGHSGVTASWTLNQMKFIAVNGYEAYKREVLQGR